jgi:hypothetical protein
MSPRSRASRYVLVAHAVVGLLFAVPMLFFAGRAATWIEWVGFDATMVKLLGAALAALAVGSLLAAREPLRNRIMVQTEIVFTVLGTFGLGWRLWFGAGYTPNFAYVGFAVLLAFAVLFSLTYPVEETRAAGSTALPAATSPDTAAETNAGTAAEGGPPPASNRSR